MIKFHFPNIKKIDIENFSLYKKVDEISINIDKDSDKKWIEQVMYDTSGRAAARRIIVIDDPISSLSNLYIFNIVSLSVEKM
mgnify:CR=1 FL=1